MYFMNSTPNSLLFRHINYVAVEQRCRLCLGKEIGVEDLDLPYLKYIFIPVVGA